MSTPANACPTCGLKRSPASTLCPKCDKSAFLAQCKAGYDAMDAMSTGKLFLVTVLCLLLNATLPSVLIGVLNPSAILTMGNEMDAVALMTTEQGVWAMVTGQFVSVFVFLLMCKNYLAGLFAKCLNGRAVLAGLVIGAIMVLLGFGWDWIKGLMQIAVNENQTAVVELTKNVPVVSFVQVVIGAALAEEIGFRAGAFSFVRRKNKVLAYIVSSLLFGLIHVNLASGSMVEILGLLMYSVMGAILAYTYEKYGLLGSMIAHAINNLVGWVQIMIA